MKQKRKEQLFILFFLLILFGVTVIDFIGKDRLFSENENRLLAQKPELQGETLLKGSYQEEYEEYVTDQFWKRDSFVRIKNQLDKTLGKQDMAGVYFATDGSLIEQHRQSDYEKLEEPALRSLEEFLEQARELEVVGQVKTMIVPTADIIYPELLPKGADVYDQKSFLDEIERVCLEEEFIPILDSLEEKKAEKLYYTTDHHWTSLGAYYGATDLLEGLGKEIEPLESYDRTIVSTDFLGTLQSKINLDWESDTIEIFEEKEKIEVEVFYDFSEQAKTSIYETKHLNTKNKYGYFLDDNHSFIQISTSVKNGESLILIKDSYANSCVPFLLSHYENIYLVDLRYYRKDVVELMEELGTRDGKIDVALLYNVIHFLE